jgi:hypothetical protein
VLKIRIRGAIIKYIRLKGYINYTLNYKLKNKPIYIIFISININIPHLCSPKAYSLIYFYLAVILKIGEKINRARSPLTFIRIKAIIINI